MKYLFDSSSIYAAVKAEKAQLLILNGTCDLARYEIGNILITERHLRKTVSETEQIDLLSIIARSLKLMVALNVSGHEQDIVDLAIKYGLSFYDASYTYLAKRNNAVLVTEDAKLAKKIRAYVEVATVLELH